MANKPFRPWPGPRSCRYPRSWGASPPPHPAGCPTATQPTTPTSSCRLECHALLQKKGEISPSWLPNSSNTANNTNIILQIVVSCTVTKEGENFTQLADQQQHSQQHQHHPANWSVMHCYKRRGKFHPAGCPTAIQATTPTSSCKLECHALLQKKG